MFDIKMADLFIRIHNKYAFVEQLCSDWTIAPETVPTVPDMEVRVKLSEFMEERQTSSGNYSKGYCESICIYRNIAKQLHRYQAFVLHASVVSIDGLAYAFLAKSGVGKSTHTRFWLDAFGDRACVVNGDKPIIRYVGGEFRAYGTPWQGKEGWGSNISAPLTACAFLHRAPVNQIRPAVTKEILVHLFHQVLLPKEREAQQVFLDLMDRLIQTVPFYLLGCNLEPQAATVAYEGMQHDM